MLRVDVGVAAPPFDRAQGRAGVRGGSVNSAFSSRMEMGVDSSYRASRNRAVVWAPALRCLHCKGEKTCQREI
jgi:hypothetical protein